MASKRKPRFGDRTWKSGKNAANREWAHRASVISRRLEIAMAKRRMRVVDVCWRSWLWPGTVSNLLKGITRTPSSRTVSELAFALRVSPGWLLGWDGTDDNPIYKRARY